jgi:hypothetical protein
MTTLHVVCDTRGRWRVDDESGAQLSEHPTATDAEFAAWRLADQRREDAVVVHDRYGRTHFSPRVRQFSRSV